MAVWKLMLAAGAMLALGVPAAGAAPVSTEVVAMTNSKPIAVVDVQYRRGWGRGWRYGARIGAGIAAGAIIYDYAYRPRRGYYYDTYDYVGPYYYPSGYRGDPRAICAQNFRSFEWRTGLYTTYGGEKKLCPYLLDY